MNNENNVKIDEIVEFGLKIAVVSKQEIKDINRHRTG